MMACDCVEALRNVDPDGALWCVESRDLVCDM